MTFEELKEKALNKEIKLEELEIEDILKFKKEGFINNELSKYFDLPTKEVIKIRKKKKIPDADYEDLVRNLIVGLDYIREECPSFEDYYINEVIISLVASLGVFRGKEDYYLDKVKNIDWKNMVTKEEIKNRGINVLERKQENPMELTIIFQLVKDYKDNIFDYEPEPYTNTNNLKEISLEKEDKKEKKSRVVQSAHRNPQKADNALERANYLCQLNPEHPTFIKRSNGKRYMEPHHLIPLEYQDYFEYSLDVEANIVSLCSNCHNELHYGKNYQELLRILYNERKENLEKCGIHVSLEVLYTMYE